MPDWRAEILNPQGSKLDSFPVRSLGRLTLLALLGFWIAASRSAEAYNPKNIHQQSNPIASEVLISTHGEGAPSPQNAINGHNGPITDLIFSPDGSLIATASQDGSIRIWDATDGSPLRTFTDHRGGVNSIAFSPNGQLMVSGSDDRTAMLWSVADGSLQRILNPLMESRVVKVEFSPDGSLVAIGGNRCVVELRRVPTGILSRTIVPLGCAPGNSGGSVDFWGLVFNSDGSRVLTGDGRPCCGGGILQWTESGEYNPPEVLNTGNVVVRDMALSPDGSEIALALVGLSDFWLLDAATGVPKAVLSDHVFRVNDVEYSPDGSLLASASNDTGIGLWRASDGALLLMLHEHRMQATSVAFSPDGLHLATGSQDGEIHIWNIEDVLGQ
ncbi:MAG: WD40 repeat domain-containing protein [Anaerolineales bacterium]